MPKPITPRKPSMLALLKPYKGLIFLLVILALASNGLTLVIPRLIAHAIDSFMIEKLDYTAVASQFLLVAFGILALTLIQNVVQVYASEKVARDLRTLLTARISRGSFLFVQNENPSKLLTYLTSDVDSVKMFVAQAVASLISSVVIILGSCIMLLTINWKLALAVTSIIPVIALTFFLVLVKVRKLFKQSRMVIDRLNKVINESILGAALVRVVHSRLAESEKFNAANSEARSLGLQILRLFAAMIPIVTFVANLGTLIILVLGGRFAIQGSMSIGDFAAFNSYVATFIFPIFIIGFMMSIISQASASYQRIAAVLEAEESLDSGAHQQQIRGDIEVKDVSVIYGEKTALKNISFSAKAGTKTAIIGPTAAGKTQLLYLLTHLTLPSSGSIEYDQKPISEYDSDSLHRQIGFVFQDSILFNLSLRENIAFSNTVTDASLAMAVETAELTEFLSTLPEGLNTVVSERGSTLSGGQKQRVMLARALALSPRVLLLDDFTARVDAKTEQKILANIARNYPGITLLSVTQKIAAVELYDKIILLMEGEILAEGTHGELLRSCPEYVQICNSQRSTSHYELPA